MQSNSLAKTQTLALLKEYTLIILGFLTLLLPSIYSLSNTLWQGEEQGQGPLLLAVIGFLFWREFVTEKSNAEPTASPLAALSFLLVACLSYVVGRSQEIFALEIGAFIPLAIAVILATQGWAGVKRYAFPIFFICFLIPLPAFIIDGLTSGLKNHISHAAEVILYQLGYPVARAGVVLTVGQYQLLVADACSGMNSLFSLISLGFLYVHLNGKIFTAKSIILLLAIVPIAIVANVIRVLILILVTYYLGDEAGQGFIHGFAGIFVFAMSLLLLFILDGVLKRVWGRT